MMKKTVFIVALVSLSLSCKQNKQTGAPLKVDKKEPMALETHYGEQFMNVKTLSPDQVMDIYKNLQPGDTVNVTFRGPVAEVCKEKGCWMKVDVGSTDPVMVRFKNYGFFVPQDIENKEVTVHGRAFIAEVRVEEQRHLAEDAGADPAVMDTISTTKRSMAFTADGVKISE